MAGEEQPPTPDSPNGLGGPGAAPDRGEQPAVGAESSSGGGFFYKLAMSGVGAFMLLQEEVENRIKSLQQRIDSGEGSGEGKLEGEHEAEPQAQAPQSGSAPGTTPEEPPTAEAPGAPRPPKARSPMGAMIDDKIEAALAERSLPSKNALRELGARLERVEQALARLEG